MYRLAENYWDIFKFKVAIDCKFKSDLIRVEYTVLLLKQLSYNCSFVTAVLPCCSCKHLEETLFSFSILYPLHFLLFYIVPAGKFLILIFLAKYFVESELFWIATSRETILLISQKSSTTDSS